VSGREVLFRACQGAGERAGGLAPIIECDVQRSAMWKTWRANGFDILASKPFVTRRGISERR
jgi:hypothetical protein